MIDSRELAGLEVALCQGRPDAWDRLYTLTHLPMLRLLRRLLSDEWAAEEAMQATFLTAIERIGEFDSARGGIDAWLMGIARKKALEASRQRRRLFAHRRFVDEHGPTKGESGFDRRDDELIAKVLDRLEPRYAEVLRRKYLAGQSLATIAKELDLKTATVGTLLHRGRQRFRQLFERLQERTSVCHARKR